MIEKIILDYLNANLSVTAHAEKPDKPPSRYVLIEKTGGSEENCINNATIAIQSYPESLAEASKLNEEVKEVMKKIITLNNIGKSKLNTDYNYTDTTKKVYRYQAVFDLTY